VGEKQRRPERLEARWGLVREGATAADVAPAVRRGRAFSLTLCAALVLAGCSGESATVRYKATAQFAVAGELHEASVVRETQYTYTPNSLTAFQAAVKDLGEGVVVDAGEGRNAIYVLLNHRTGDKVFPFIVTRCFGVETESDPEWPAALKSIPIGKQCALNAESLGNSMPLVVAFRDEMEPKSIFEVTRESYRDTFGVEAGFIELSLERVDDRTPLTSGIDKRLPWLNRIPFDGRVRVLDPFVDWSKLTAAQATLANRVTDWYFRDTGH
jgi:hypothetical protein